MTCVECFGKLEQNIHKHAIHAKIFFFFFCLTRRTDYTAVCTEFHFYSANIKRHDMHLKLLTFFCGEAERALLLYYFRLKWYGSINWQSPLFKSYHCLLYQLPSDHFNIFAFLF